MQYINHWPDMAELTLPKPVSQDFYRQLLEPFDDKSSAKEFGDETSSTIIIMDPKDSIEESEIEFALTYPERKSRNQGGRLVETDRSMC